MEVFVAVAEAGTFATAAARLGMSPPAATRAVAALEDSIGVRLLNRTTRRLSLTEAGALYLTSTRRLLDEIGAAERLAAGEEAVPSGHLTITCSVTFGRIYVVDLIAAFLELQPRVTASVRMLDRVVNLVEEGIDVAIRIGALPDSSLRSCRIGETRRVLVASPDYLERCGTPQRPDDLKAHAVIALTGLMPHRELRHVVEDGRIANVALSPRLWLNDAAAALHAAEHGEGIAVALSYMVAAHVAQGRLTPVLEDFAPPPIPIQIVYPEARLLAPKIRAFMDFAAPWLRKRLSYRAES